LGTASNYYTNNDECQTLTALIDSNPVSTPSGSHWSQSFFFAVAIARISL
jgi:hypothetical protein